MINTNKLINSRRIAMLYAGIDLHKNYILITVINGGGFRISQIRINNDIQKIANFFAQFTEPVRIVIEATLNWYWIVELLDNLGYDIVLAHPKKLRAIVDAKLEDDNISSYTLAQLLRNDYIPTVYYLSPEIRALRDLCRTRLFLVRQRSALMNSCRSTLLKYNIMAPENQRLYSQNGLDYLKDPELNLHELYKFGLWCKSDLIEFITEKITILENKINKQTIEDGVIKNLITISGIGDVLAPTIRYEVGVMSRFRDDKHFSSYCRYTPKIHKSGKRNKHYKTSKEGNAYLKWAFSEVTVNAIKYDTDIRKRYQKLKSKKGKPIALSIIGRNMTTVVYHVWTKHEEYKGFKKININKEQ